MHYEINTAQRHSPITEGSPAVRDGVPEEVLRVTHAAHTSAPQQTRPILIVGAGQIVRDAHLPAYRSAGFSVAAIVDVDAGRAGALAKSFSIPIAKSSIAEAMRQSPKDCVFDVAVPAGVILDVLAQLPDGAAVLMQKPMGNTLEEAEQILVCHAKGLTAAINFQLRYAPVMLAAKRIAEAGLLGLVHDMQVIVNVHTPWDMWAFLSQAPRLEILYHSIHYLDLVRTWFGNPRTVLARTVRNPQTASLSATKSVILLDYGEWQRVYIATNHGHRYKESQQSYVQWEGSEGTMRAVMGLNLDYPKGVPDTLQFARPQGGWHVLPTQGDWIPDAFGGSMGALQSYVTGAAPTLPSRVEDAIDTMRMVEAAYISAEQDGVPLPGA